MLKVKSLAVIALLAFVTSVASNVATASDVIYKWTDTTGQIKYTQSKPPSGISYTVIRNRSNKEVEAKKLVADSAESNIDSKQDEMIATQNAEMNKVDKLNAQRAAKNCTISRNNLQALERTTRIQITEGGKKRVLSDSERTKAMTDAKTNIDKYCI